MVRVIRFRSAFVPLSRLLAASALVVLSISLSGCGRKGDLELPPQPQDFDRQGKLKPDAPVRPPGQTPIFKDGFVLDPLL
jgi:predicted small lipoprotein YifL